MATSERQEDLPTNVWPAIVDDYLTAMQAGDAAEQLRLLQLHPELAGWTDEFRQFEDLADSFTDQRPSFPSFTEGIRFGKYELRGELGRGGMGVVFRAFQSELDRTVALKMLTGSPFASHDQRRRFDQEARLASRIRHPNIVTIHEVGEIGGQPYFTMEYIAGSNLASRLREGALAIDQAVQWMIQIAHAVEYLHCEGIVHRDLKPSNVLLDSDGKPCLVDFGLARAMDDFRDPTVTGTVLGTPSYMSPEQAAGRIRDITGASDVYSLGAILYEMLCGQPPFQAESPFDTVLQVLEREPLPPRQWNQAIPKSLEQICLRCLEKSPAMRYSSAAELAQDLERWTHGDHLVSSSRSPVLHAIRTIRRYPSAAYRLLGLVPIILIIVLRCVIAPQFWRFYSPILAGLGVWAGLSVLWEWQSVRPMARKWTDIAFLLTDIACLTSLLSVSQSVNTSHVTAYFLIIVLAGLSLNRFVIWIAGVGCIAGYLSLVLQSHDPIPWHVPTITVVLLACCAGVTDYHVRRLSIWIRPKIVESTREISDEVA